MSDIVQMKNLIGGHLVDSASTARIDVIDPSMGKVYGSIPRSGMGDVLTAIDCAEQARHEWGAASPNTRYESMMAIAAGIHARFDELAEAESLDNGKPLSLARKVDIPRAIANFEFFASAALHRSSEAHDMGGQAINYTLKLPLGTVACISPWNLPLYLLTWKIAPALAAGNCVIAKPSEVTPYTAYLLSEIAIEAGLPPGVLQMLHGYGPEIGPTLCTHQDIKAISFTGSTATGRAIAEAAAPHFKKLSLEMGGKNPNIIFADADFDEMLKTTIRSSFANQGQICLCGSRIFVERARYDQFKEAFVERVNGMTVGPPSDDVQLGALVSEAHMDKVLSYIELAKEEGGTILTGGDRVHLPPPHDQGYFVAPTVIEGLSYDCRTNQEEIFGPVVTITPFDSEEEVLQMANSTPYGLSATLWTNDLNRVQRLSRKLDAGILWVNTWLLRDLRTPFGGMKDSGMGREGGWAAMDFFSEKKNVCLRSL